MLNKVVLMGRLTADPEHKQTPNGVAVTSFSIAVERNYADKTTNEKQTDFINIVAWRNTADIICKFFHKGDLIAIDGCIQTRKYQDKNGNNRTAFEVVAEQVYFTGSKKEQSTQQTGNNAFTVDDFEECNTSDIDVPF